MGELSALDLRRKPSLVLYLALCWNDVLLKWFFVESFCSSINMLKVGHFGPKIWLSEQLVLYAFSLWLDNPNTWRKIGILSPNLNFFLSSIESILKFFDRMQKHSLCFPRWKALKFSVSDRVFIFIFFKCRTNFCSNLVGQLNWESRWHFLRGTRMASNHGLCWVQIQILTLTSSMWGCGQIA